MVNRRDFVSTRNYLLISGLHYCLWPAYLIVNIFLVKKRQTNRILFIELGHMGDMLTTAAVMKLVKEKRKDSQIVCLCSPSAAVALNNNPFVDEIEIIDSPIWYKTKRKEGDSFLSSFKLFLKTLKSIGASSIINVRATSYHIDHIATWLAGARERVGFGNKGLGYLLTYSGNAPSAMPLPLQKLNLVSDWLGLHNRRDTLAPLFFAAEKFHPRVDLMLGELGLAVGERIIGVNPGAQHNFLWPEKYFVELCNLIHQKYKVKLLFLGTPAHEEMIKRIQGQIPFRTYSLAGKTNLDELFVLLGRLAMLITIDTGIRHLANAASVPLVDMRFGADGYERYGKYVESETVIIHRVVCSPCGKETCPLAEMVCMTGIKPQEVFNATIAVMDAHPSLKKQSEN
ncbi:lipopolysaccharide heptosyltransferase II [soil metagenome]